MNSQPSSSCTRTTVFVGGGAPAMMIRTRSRPGISPSQVCGGLEHRGGHGGRGAHTVTPCSSTRRRISAPSTLRSTTCGTPRPVIANGMPQPLAWNIGSVWR